MMMRKTSLILLGAAAGVAVTLIATPPRIALDGARVQATAADTYRQLSLFGDVFERVLFPMSERSRRRNVTLKCGRSNCSWINLTARNERVNVSMQV
jgi:hypothetical protein